MFTHIEANTICNKFITIIEEVIDKMVPTKILKERSYPKWMTRRAKHARELKYTIWARFRSSKEYTHCVEYKEHTIRLLRKTEESNVILFEKN